VARDCDSLFREIDDYASGFDEAAEVRIAPELAIVSNIPTARYEIWFERDNEVHSVTSDFEEAKRAANQLSNWNHAAQIVDSQTKLALLSRCAME
jgi:hypothetical protein